MPTSYPFDCQMLQIRVKIREIDGSNLAYWFQPVEERVVPQLVHPYRFRRDQGHACHNADKLHDMDIWGLYGAREKGMGDCYTVTVVVKRDWKPILLNVMVTMILSAALGSLTFFLETYAEQMVTLVVTLLTVTSFKLQNRDQLPHTPVPSALET